MKTTETESPALTAYLISKYRSTADNVEPEHNEEHSPSTLSQWKKCLSGLLMSEAELEKNELIEKLMVAKQNASGFDEWYEICLELDELTNTAAWKEKEETKLYDYNVVKAHLEKLRQARMKQDYKELLYIIRTTWMRNLGNMGNLNLYRHSHVGTKTLIDEYMHECQLALDVLVDESNMDDKYLMGTLIQTRKNIGRTALVLSGGGCFGMFHIGVLSTLLEQDIMPRIVSGSSAGAIVAGILCVHKKSEMTELLEKILSKDLNIFNDDSSKSSQENFLIKLSRFLKNGTWFDNKNLQNTMIEFLGDLTFREAYNRTGKILNITVSPASVHEQPRLLNYLTTPTVLIWSAVCASCSLPGVFPSSTIYEKNTQTGQTQEWNHSSVKFVDGSVDNDMPISRLSEMFNVDHIIACQVNVHVFPFLKLSITCVGGEIEDEFSARLKSTLGKAYDFMANEVAHALEIGTELGIAKNLLTKLRSVVCQQYSGDITILPDMNMLLRINELLTNPTKEFVLREAVNGARATWPKVPIIKNHCCIEFALDKAIMQIKSRLVTNASLFSWSDVSLLSQDPERDDNIDAYDYAERNVSNVSGHGVEYTPTKKTKKRHHDRRKSEQSERIQNPPLRQVYSSHNIKGSNIYVSSRKRSTGNIKAAIGNSPRLRRRTNSITGMPKNHSSVFRDKSLTRSGSRSNSGDSDLSPYQVATELSSSTSTLKLSAEGYDSTT